MSFLLKHLRNFRNRQKIKRAVRHWRKQNSEIACIWQQLEHELEVEERREAFVSWKTENAWVKRAASNKAIDTYMWEAWKACWRYLAK